MQRFIMKKIKLTYPYVNGWSIIWTHFGVPRSSRPRSNKIWISQQIHRLKSRRKVRTNRWQNHKKFNFRCRAYSKGGLSPNHCRSNRQSHLLFKLELWLKNVQEFFKWILLPCALFRRELFEEFLQHFICWEMSNYLLANVSNYILAEFLRNPWHLPIRKVDGFT